MKTFFRKSFTRDLKKIKDQRIRNRVRQAIEDIESATAPEGISNLKKLTGTEDSYRIRVADFRIGVVIEEDVVEFVRCLPRRDLYRFFP